MDIETINMIQKIDFYQKKTDSKDPFVALIQSIANKENTGEGDAYFRDNHLPLLEAIAEDCLTNDHGVLLAAAIDKGLPNTVEYLLQQTDTWPRHVVENGLIKASEKGFDNTFCALFKGSKYASGEKYKKALEVAGDDDMRYTLGRLKTDMIGEDWRINENYEIQRQTSSPGMVTVFNFASCHVTSWVPSGNGTNTVVQRDFEELQSDEELQIAYNKLAQFETNIPPYRGKDYRATRRISKRKNMAGG